MRGVRIQFDTVCVVQSADMTRVFDDGYLHTKAEAKVRNLIFSRVFCGKDHAFNATAAESARNKDTGNITEHLGNIFLGQCLGIHPFEIYGRALCDTAVF